MSTHWARQAILFLVFLPGAPSIVDAALSYSQKKPGLLVRGAVSSPKAMPSGDVVLIHRPGDDPLGVIRDPERNQIIELKPDEVGPVATVRYMDNHWHQFSPIFHEAKALMLRHRETSVAEAAPNPVGSNQ